MAMHDDLRWAARFAFLEELWRDRARVVVDRGLEAWLSAGVAPESDDDPVAAMVDRLLPASGGGARAFMATHEAATARELSRTRPATNFVAVDRLPDLLQHRDFQIAVIELASIDVDADAETTAVLHSSATEVAVSPRALGPTARRVLERLGEAARAGKAVAIVLPAGPGPGAFDDVTAMELLTRGLGGGRLYGLYRPRMAALVDYGAPDDGQIREGLDDEDLDEDLDEDFEGELESDDELDDDAFDDAADEDADEADDRETVARLQPDDDDGEPDADDEVPLSFDNTLGTMTPHMEEWLLVAGVAAPADGLSLLEVRAAGGLAPIAAAPPASWRTQLAEAQRQADLQAIEVQRWIERADALTADNERLRIALAEAEDGLVRAVHAAEPAAPEPPHPQLQIQARLEAAGAEVQALKWRVAQLEDQLQAARARPLDELEAELEAARAQLETQLATRLDVADVRGSAGPGQGQGQGQLEGDRAPPWSGASQGPAEPSPGTHVQAAVRVLESLVHRLERGGIEAVKLREDLLALKRRLHRLHRLGTRAAPLERGRVLGPS